MITLIAIVFIISIIFAYSITCFIFQLIDFYNKLSNIDFEINENEIWSNLIQK